MTLENTTRYEDETIKEFTNGQRISDLIEIIERLDSVIESWKTTTGYSTPEEYESETESKP